MVDFDLARNRDESQVLVAVRAVVRTLRDEIGIDPSHVLLVGAASRDVIHVALGHTFAARATHDIDLGLWVASWSATEAIARRYRIAGTSGIRHRIAQIAVDVMPFGPVEDPPGTSAPGGSGTSLVVFGFASAYARALALPLGEGLTVRIPTPAAYTALKLRAWIERSPGSEYKDADDLALALYWAEQDDDAHWAAEANEALMQEVEFDPLRCGARLLGREIAATLTAVETEDLSRRLRAMSLDTLASHLRLPRAVPQQPKPHATYVLALNELLRGMNETARS